MTIGGGMFLDRLRGHVTSPVIVFDPVEKHLLERLETLAGIGFSQKGKGAGGELEDDESLGGEAKGAKFDLG